MSRSKANDETDKQTRIAIVSEDKCKPKRCRQECKKSCPVVRMGKLCIEVSPNSKIASLSEELCIGCGICVKVCIGSFLKGVVLYHFWLFRRDFCGFQVIFEGFSWIFREFSVSLHEMRFSCVCEVIFSVIFRIFDHFHWISDHFHWTSHSPSMSSHFQANLSLISIHIFLLIFQIFQIFQFKAKYKNISTKPPFVLYRQYLEMPIRCHHHHQHPQQFGEANNASLLEELV